MSLSLIDLSCAAAALVSFHLLYQWFSGNARQRFPPGPRGLPFVGNIRDIPSMPTWVEYRKWSDTYGSPILRLNILGQDIIILNTLQAVSDLLEKRSAIYSDRPEWTMINELCGGKWSFSTARYGQEWRTRRKLFHSQFHSQISGRFRPIEEKAAHRFLLCLLDAPEEFLSHVRLWAGSQIAEIAFGFDVKSREDPCLKVAEDAMACSRELMSAGSFLVDSFPLLKHLPMWCPGATFKHQAKKWRVPILGTLNMPFDEYQRRCGLGEEKDCIAAALLDQMRNRDEEEASFTEKDVKAVLAIIHAAGSDTTVSTIQSFILAMVLFPEVQRKAQAEIDAICADRLPKFDDLDALPYVQAIVNEALRWNPVVPEAEPHALTEDDMYEGYMIPKGSIIVPNSWAILHEEEFYPEPFDFNPDRFMKNGALDPDVLNPDVAAFGYGRRICPGRFMARDSIWITVACTLAAFDIRPAKSPDGHPAMPSGEYTWAFLCHPKPFQCEIYPRSLQHKSLIKAVSPGMD